MLTIYLRGGIVQGATRDHEDDSDRVRVVDFDVEEESDTEKIDGENAWVYEVEAPLKVSTFTTGA